MFISWSAQEDWAYDMTHVSMAEDTKDDGVPHELGNCFQFKAPVISEVSTCPCRSFCYSPCVKNHFEEYLLLTLWGYRGAMQLFGGVLSMCIYTLKGAAFKKKGGGWWTASFVGMDGMPTCLSVCLWVGEYFLPAVGIPTYCPNFAPMNRLVFSKPFSELLTILHKI